MRRASLAPLRGNGKRPADGNLYPRALAENRPAAACAQKNTTLPEQVKFPSACASMADAGISAERADGRTHRGAGGQVSAEGRHVASAAGSGPAGGAGKVRAAAYRAARRHSARVRIMKILLPVSAVLMMAVFAGATVLRQALPDNVSMGSVALSDGGLVMNNPKLTGTTKSGGSYTMTASRAIQDLGKPSLIRLEHIRATVPVEGQGLARLDAPSGLYERGAEKLSLDRPFRVTTENGLRAELASARIDLASGTMDTADPVDIRVPEAHIVADRFSMADKGATLTFEGKVRMVIEPSAAKSGRAPAASREN